MVADAAERRAFRESVARRFVRFPPLNVPKRRFGGPAVHNFFAGAAAAALRRAPHRMNAARMPRACVSNTRKQLFFMHEKHDSIGVFGISCRSAREFRGAENFPALCSAFAAPSRTEIADDGGAYTQN
jgi:hypothetical protein